MTFNELVSMYFERFNATQTLWGLYITIMLGILAFFGTIAPSKRTTRLALLIAIGFVAFAIVNAMALSYVVDARATIYHVVQNYKAHDSKEDQAVIDQMKQTVTPMYPTWMLLLFHACGDVGVLAAIWRLTQHRRELARGES